MEFILIGLLIVALEFASFVVLPLFAGPLAMIAVIAAFFVLWKFFSFAVLSSLMIAWAACYLGVLVRHRMPAAAYVGEMFNMLIGSSKGNHSFRSILRRARQEEKLARRVQREANWATITALLKRN